LELLRKPVDRLPSQHVTIIIQAAYRSAAQFILYLACLPFEAWYSLIAILRTGWRTLISHRHLLEWVPSEQVDQHFQGAPANWFIRMWVGPVAALTTVMTLLIHDRWQSL